MTATPLHVVLTNETRNSRIYDDMEPIAKGKTPGEMYRDCVREYGRCKSKVYVDQADGAAIHVGWFFERLEKYTDADETYLRGAGSPWSTFSLES